MNGTKEEILSFSHNKISKSKDPCTEACLLVLLKKVTQMCDLAIQFVRTMLT